MTEKILILGASGYLGSAFVRECDKRGIESFAAIRGAGHHYDNRQAFDWLMDFVNPSLVINCAAFIPSPSVDACKDYPFETMATNVELPTMLAKVCSSEGVPLMHLSTGCLFDEQREYSETDVPTRGWQGYCGFYVGTKIAAEQIVSKIPQHYILRLRLPFDEFDHPRNYLTKIAGFKTVFTHTNSLSHRGDFVKAALDLWQMRAAFGTYHMVNPGFVTAAETVALLMRQGIVAKVPQFGDNVTVGCKLSTKKLLAAGVKIRDVHEALEHAVKNWRKA